jgi:RNA recognition motif-containing protein
MLTSPRFGFVQYYSFESCENCIRGFFYLGYQASFAQKSRNSRLKDLEDRSSTNIYCTNIPIDWTEAVSEGIFAASLCGY